MNRSKSLIHPYSVKKTLRRSGTLESILDVNSRIEVVSDKTVQKLLRSQSALDSSLRNVNCEAMKDSTEGLSILHSEVWSDFYRIINFSCFQF